MKINFGLICLLFCCALIFGGCAGVSHKEKNIIGLSLLEPQTILKFSDIPVPMGFKLLPQESYSFEASGVRVGVLRYQGKANTDHIVNFYKEQMSMYGWNLVNIVEYDQRLMNFERETESCIVNISPKGNSNTVTISLGPKSQVYRKSEKPIK